MIESFIEVPEGEPKNFMTENEFRNKFNGLCAPYICEDKLEVFSDLLLGFERATLVGSFFQ